MAGNASDARRRAEEKLQQAIRAGVDRRDIEILKAAFSAACAEEDRQTGTNPFRRHY